MQFQESESARKIGVSCGVTPREECERNLRAFAFRSSSQHDKTSHNLCDLPNQLHGHLGIETLPKVSLGLIGEEKNLSLVDWVLGKKGWWF